MQPKGKLSSSSILQYQTTQSLDIKTVQIYGFNKFYHHFTYRGCCKEDSVCWGLFSVGVSVTAEREPLCVFVF